MQSETEENIKRRNVLSSFRRQTLIIREKFKRKFFHLSIKKIVGNQILNVRNFKSTSYILYIRCYLEKKSNTVFKR